MREILFKGKCIKEGKWVEGTYARCESPYYSSENINHYIVQPPRRFAAIHLDTLCQYTGMLDRYNNKIYENDIVKLNGDEIYKVVFKEDDAMFVAEGINITVDITLGSMHGSEYEVVGNIYNGFE